jgi:hypothetical protein
MKHVKYSVKRNGKHGLRNWVFVKFGYVSSWVWRTKVEAGKTELSDLNSESFSWTYC